MHPITDAYAAQEITVFIAPKRLANLCMKYLKLRQVQMHEELIAIHFLLYEHIVGIHVSLSV